jgi:AraC-like DNA-binding protein
MNYSDCILEITNYINANLTEDLSLDKIATHIHYSSYWISRYYHKCTGETIMSYVLKQRLRRAACELLDEGYNISELAMKYCFESQDGFCRAFKKYYGVTPGKYKIAIKLKERMKNILEGRTMYGIDILNNIICDKDDKREALLTLDKVLELSKKARAYGLASLESDTDNIQSAFFRKAIWLIVDGTEPEIVKDSLMNYTLSGGNTGKELLVHLLIIEGIISIQCGMHTHLIREKLASFFGDSFIAEMEQHYGMEPEMIDARVNQYILENQDEVSLRKECSLLEDPFIRMSERSLQRLLRDIDFETMAYALKGASVHIRVKVLRNVSPRHAVRIIDELDICENLTDVQINDAQKYILETMKILIKQGDLII